MQKIVQLVNVPYKNILVMSDIAASVEKNTSRCLGYARYDKSIKSQLVLLLSIFLFATYLLPAQKPAETISDKSDTVFVKGLIKKPFILTVKDIAGLTAQTVEKKDATGEIKKSMPGFKGVLLKDIIDLAQVQMDNKKQQGKYFIVITATDGYQVIFAYDEMMYSPASNSTYLLWEEDGQPLSDTGPFAVRCTSDINTSPRHVKWVREIEIRKI